jgi:hypothetical protein
MTSTRERLEAELERERMREMDALLRDIRNDQRNDPTRVRSALLEKDRPKADPVPRPAWMEPMKLETPYVKECDRIADYFDRLDRLERKGGR